MIDPADLVGLPPPEEPSAEPASPRSRPRNYLAAGERRQLFWRFMPPALAVVLALTVIEWIWLTPSGPPAPPTPPIDTRLDAVRGPGPRADEVLIEREPEPLDAPAADLGAPESALAKVRDDTVFRAADMQAWEQTLVTLRDTEPGALERAPAARVTFGELFNQPRSFRGRLVRLRGDLRRLERLEAPRNQYGIEAYWEGWLEPEGGPNDPIVIHFLRLPEGMATGMKIREPVEVVGYFFKRWAYGAKDTIRVAPLVLALEPESRRPPAAAPSGISLGTLALGSMAILVGCMVLVAALSGRRAGGRAAAPPVDLSASLAGHEPYSVAEELRRLGGAERRHEGHHS